MFEWLRRRVRDAVFAGVNDAMEQLMHGAEDHSEAPKLLEARIRDAEPAAEEQAPRSRKRA